MPFIPHTADDTDRMLAVIGVAEIDELFDEIPRELRCGPMIGLPDGMTEQEVSRLMTQRSVRDNVALNFLGAGAYEHHIPAAVWELATRGEFYSAYTPYQAEASQGTLQLIYEYQSMMASLTGLDVSNASLYDGASAMAEAVLMAVRANRASKSRKVLVPETVHPSYTAVTRTITASQGIELVPLAFDRQTGRTDPAELELYAGSDITAVVIPQPNVFGVLEDIAGLTNWANEQGAIGIGVVNPVSLGILAPPGAWGTDGVGIACGEGQPLGVPLSSGGPYFGFVSCRQAFIRQLPGRIVGRTIDVDGRSGFTLTLQAREQHIRRSRATSNICTNQGLMVTAATMHMSLLGPEGLRGVAASCHANTRALADAVTAVGGAEAFPSPGFHEVVLRLPVSASRVASGMLERGIVAGLPLAEWYPDLGDCLLVCATETKTAEDIERYAEALQGAIEAERAAQ